MGKVMEIIAVEMATVRDWYAVLGVRAQATAGEIRGAYKKLVLEVHPDKHRGGEDEDERRRKRFEEVQKAWEVLGNDERRAAYDATVLARENQTKVAVSANVDLDEMQYDEESGVYSYACRCGDVFAVSEDVLLAVEGNSCVLACGSCSLHVRVLFEVDEGEEEEDGGG